MLFVISPLRSVRMPVSRLESSDRNSSATLVVSRSPRTKRSSASRGSGKYEFTRSQVYCCQQVPVNETQDWTAGAARRSGDVPRRVASARADGERIFDEKAPATAC